MTNPKTAIADTVPYRCTHGITQGKTVVIDVSVKGKIEKKTVKLIEIGGDSETTVRQLSPTRLSADGIIIMWDGSVIQRREMTLDICNEMESNMIYSMRCNNKPFLLVYNKEGVSNVKPISEEFKDEAMNVEISNENESKSVIQNLIAKIEANKPKKQSCSFM